MNDRRLNSYLAFAEASADDDLGGRWASPERKPTITGSSAGPSYPSQPPNSPWGTEPIGTEPPLGYDINAVEHEIAASSPSSQPEGGGVGNGPNSDGVRPVVRPKGFRRV